MRVAVAWILVFSLARSAPDAFAQSAPPLAHSLRGEALAEYEGGRALFKEGDYPGALARFRRAGELSSDPRLLWDMAACEQKLGHIAKMASLIDKYLATGGGLLTDADRRLATRLENSVRGHMSAVTVTTTPDGVDVLVDDELVGKTPIEEPFWVDEGTHRVVFKKAGWKDALVTQNAQGAGSTTWTMTLEREAKPPPPPPPALPPKPVVAEPPPPPRTSPSRVPPILLLGAGVLQLGGGAVLVGLAESKFTQLRHDCSPACDPASTGSWPTLETVGDVLLVTGGVSIAAGIVWWIALPSGSSRTSGLWLAPAPGGAALGGAL